MDGKGLANSPNARIARITAKPPVAYPRRSFFQLQPVERPIFRPLGWAACAMQTQSGRWQEHRRWLQGLAGSISIRIDRPPPIPGLSSHTIKNLMKSVLSWRYLDGLIFQVIYDRLRSRLGGYHRAIMVGDDLFSNFLIVCSVISALLLRVE